MGNDGRVTLDQPDVLTVFLHGEVCDRYIRTKTLIPVLYPVFRWGGILYLYRKEIGDFVVKHRWIVFGVCIAATVIWYAVPRQMGDVQLFTIESLILFMLWLLYAIGARSRFLKSRIMKYFGGISMEMYLVQMVVFRVIEKSGMLYKFGYGWLSFGIVMVLEIGFWVVGIELWKQVTNNTPSLIKRVREKRRK